MLLVEMVHKYNYTTATRRAARGDPAREQETADTTTRHTGHTRHEDTGHNGQRKASRERQRGGNRQRYVRRTALPRE